MRSASLAISLCGALALTGCVTTQQRNERYKIRADRTLASRKPLIVRTPGRDVRVDRVSVVRARRGGAVVVELSNLSARALSDLPISVGVTAGGRRTYLNQRGGLDFFQTHVAAVAPRGRARWVFTSRRRIGAGRPFAVVGRPARSADALPSIAAVATAGRAVRVRVDNPSGIPQYGVPVYALARRGGRWVAAGRATLPELGTGRSVTVHVPLLGAARGAPIQLEALPTILE